MIIPTLDTVSYTCADNKCYLVWVYDKTVIGYEIYRNDFNNIKGEKYDC